MLLFSSSEDNVLAVALVYGRYTTARRKFELTGRGHLHLCA